MVGKHREQKWVILLASVMTTLLPSLYRAAAEEAGRENRRRISEDCSKYVPAALREADAYYTKGDPAAALPAQSWAYACLDYQKQQLSDYIDRVSKTKGDFKREELEQLKRQAELISEGLSEGYQALERAADAGTDIMAAIPQLDFAEIFEQLKELSDVFRAAADADLKLNGALEANTQAKELRRWETILDERLVEARGTLSDVSLSLAELKRAFAEAQCRATDTCA
jgi:hypothetical protein